MEEEESEDREARFRNGILESDVEVEPIIDGTDVSHLYCRGH